MTPPLASRGLAAGGSGALVAAQSAPAEGLVAPPLVSIGMAAGAAIVERSAEESAALVVTNWPQESAAASVAVPMQLSLPGSAAAP